MTVHAISLLGSTGSIGTNVLRVIRQFPDRFRVTGLAAGENIDLLAAQVEEFAPEVVAVAREALCPVLLERLPGRYRQKIFAGNEGLCRVATHGEADMVVIAVVGAVGLLPTLEAIRVGKDIGLANKETLVMAGELVMAEIARCQVRLLPIDSEHSAIFQALEAGRREDVRRIILTASGGPFRSSDARGLAQVTPEQAIAHPNWDMGMKISVDSATLMNKGLEVIEARWLFGMRPDQIGVVVHPQSIVHSLVEFIDGSVVGQLGIPDMRIPIAYALSYPERLPLGLERLSMSQCGRLDFEEPDYSRFPALGLAFQALERGGIMPAVLNAANEVAVAAFCAHRLRFTDIATVVATTMESVPEQGSPSLQDILEADQQARLQAQACIRRQEMA